MKKNLFTHKSPPVGLNYYRIKQIDFDGNFSYSDVASVLKRSENEVILYPNPSNDGMFNVKVF